MQREVVGLDTSLALDLASSRLPLGTFWRCLAELYLADTSLSFHGLFPT